MECQIHLFSRPLRAQLPIRTRTMGPLIVILSPTRHLCLPQMVVVNYPVPTNAQEVCLSVLLSIQSQRFPHLAFSFLPNLSPMNFR